MQPRPRDPSIASKGETRKLTAPFRQTGHRDERLTTVDGGRWRLTYDTYDTKVGGRDGNWTGNRWSLGRRYWILQVEVAGEAVEIYGQSQSCSEFQYPAAALADTPNSHFVDSWMTLSTGNETKRLTGTGGWEWDTSIRTLYATVCSLCTPWLGWELSVSSANLDPILTIIIFADV